MFLLEPEHTQFDLRFRMLGTDVRVHPMFWLVSAFLGWSFLDAGFSYLFLWVVWVFVSILLHEFGHVLAGRLFGTDGHIVLYSFGGLAIGSSNLASRWQRVVVFFAGPGIQLVFYGALWCGLHYFLLPRMGWKSLSPMVRISLLQLLWINWFWPMLNLLPIWPLDGGKIARELFDWLMPGRGIRTALGISLLVSGFLAVNALAGYAGHPLIESEYLPSGDLYIALLFGLLAFSNFQELQQVSSKPWREEYPDRWEQDGDYWKRR